MLQAIIQYRSIIYLLILSWFVFIKYEKIPSLILIFICIIVWITVNKIIIYFMKPHKNKVLYIKGEEIRMISAHVKNPSQTFAEDFMRILKYANDNNITSLSIKTHQIVVLNLIYGNSDLSRREIYKFLSQIEVNETKDIDVTFGSISIKRVPDSFNMAAIYEYNWHEWIFHIKQINKNVKRYNIKIIF